MKAKGGRDEVPRTASCACGDLRVTCTGEPRSVSLCHCLDCQKRTGSAFGVAAFFAGDAVGVEGASNAFERLSESGHAVTFHFCPRCGSTVFWEPERKPDTVAVAVGTFADPSFPPPANSAWPERRHPWVTVET